MLFENYIYFRKKELMVTRAVVGDGGWKDSLLPYILDRGFYYFSVECDPSGR